MWSHFLSGYMISQFRKSTSKQTSVLSFLVLAFTSTRCFLVLNPCNFVLYFSRLSYAVFEIGTQYPPFSTTSSSYSSICGQHFLNWNNTEYRVVSLTGNRFDLILPKMFQAHWDDETLQRKQCLCLLINCTEEWNGILKDFWTTSLHFMNKQLGNVLNCFRGLHIILKILRSYQLTFLFNLHIWKMVPWSIISYSWHNF